MCGFITATQPTEFDHDLSLHINLGNQINATFVDLSNAFDTAVHSKLLLKLHNILNN